jgi:signal transduction histidine kinase
MAYSGTIQKALNSIIKTTEAKGILGGADVRNLLVDSIHKKIWISSSYGGIDVIDLTSGSVVKRFSQEKYPALENNLIKSFLLVNNTAFLGCERGFYELDLYTEKLREIVIPGYSSKDVFVRLVTEIEQGKLLILLKDMKAFLYDIQKRVTIEKRFVGGQAINNSDQTVFYSYSLCRKGQVCIISSAGLSFYNWRYSNLIYDSINPLYAKLKRLNGISIRRAVYDRSGKLWLATTGGLFEYTGEEIRAVLSNDESHPGSYWLNSIYTICVDDDNNIWLGCQNGVACLQNKPPPFISYSYSEKSRTKIRHAYYLYPVNDSIILSAAQEGLYEVNKKTYSITSIDQGITYDFAFSDPYGRLIVSNATGLFILNGRQKIPIDSVYGEYKQFSNIRINSSISINDSCLALGSENDEGVFIWNYVEHRLSHFYSRSERVRLIENNVNNLYKLANNRFLILSDASFSLFDYEKMSVKDIRLYKSNNREALNIFFDICKIKDTFFLACYGQGVIKLNKDFKPIGSISTFSGLSNDGVYKILPWKDSILIISTNNGLNAYFLRDGSIKQFYRESGLQDNVFEETSGNVYKDEIFAGGANGLTAVLPERIVNNNKAPLLLINAVWMEKPNNQRSDTTNLMMKEFIIPNNVLQTNIHFSGINYSNPDRTIFRYKIKELNDDWIDLGTKNFISLIAVYPNTYHLEIKAANEDGVWSEPIELTLIFLPKWYQTWWFKTMMVLLLLGILYSLYRYRLAQIRKEQQIRQRIASDLHDDIGSTLNSVKVFTNLALMKPENNITYLQQLKEGVQNAIVGVRDMVWVLDDKQDTLGHLLERIELFIIPLASAQDIRFEKSLDAPLAYILLKKEEKRNLYLIIKEALNNSIKYASATTLQLIVEKVSHDRYIITIRDDGKGFNRDLIQKGNGLNNLQYRAQQIKYAIEIDSVPGKGTTITLIRP